MGGYGKGPSSGYWNLHEALVEAGAEDTGDGNLSLKFPLATVKVVLEVSLGEIVHEASIDGTSYSVAVSAPGADGKIQLPAEKLVLLSSLTKKPKKNPLSE